MKIDGGTAKVGITDYAQKQLGDVVYLELPEVGRALKKGEVFGTIESVKAVSGALQPRRRRGHRGARRARAAPRGSQQGPAQLVDDRRESRPAGRTACWTPAAYTELTK